MDYFVYVNEDFHVDGILAELGLADYYSIGDYTIEILRGRVLIGICPVLCGCGICNAHVWIVCLWDSQ